MEPAVPPPPQPTWRTHQGSGREDLFHTCMRRAYFPFLVKFQRPILCLWVVILGLSAAYGPLFFGLTKSDFSQPPGTPSYTATAALNALYPSFGGWPPAFVVQTSSAPGGVLGPASIGFSKAASTRLDQWAQKYRSFISPPAGFWELSAAGPSLAVLAAATVSSSNRTMRTYIGFQPNATIAQINKFASALVDFAPTLSGGPVKVAATGLFPLFSEMSHATEVNFALIDAIVLPIAVLILGYYVRSYRHMGLALLSLGMALLLAFAVLVPVCDTVNINPFAPSIMLSLGIAVCFDYTLFLVTRFKEQRLEAGLCCEDAVFSTMVTSGHVILLSGCTLALTFFLLLFFPQNFLLSVGISCSAVVISSILVNMSVLPALLLQFECMSFFDLYPTSTANCCCRVPREDPVAFHRRKAALAAAAAAVAAAAAAAAAGAKGGAPAPQGGPAAVGAAAEPASSLHLREQEAQPAPKAAPTPRTLWFHLSWSLSGPIARYAVMLAIAGITVPFFIAFLDIKPSSDDYLIYLQDSSSLNALQDMQKDFSLGSLDPYSIMIDTGVPGGVLGPATAPAYWALEAAVVARVLATQGPVFVGPGSVTGLSYFNGAQVSFSQGYGGYLNASSPLFASPEGVAYRASCLGGLSDAGGANLVTVTTLVNPNSQGVIPFVVDTRNVLAGIEGQYCGGGGAFPALKLYLLGGYTTTMDIQDALYKLVPAQISIVLALVLLIVGVSFGSVVLVLRLLYTIFVSLSWTYGLMVLVYQPGPAQTAFAVLTPSITASVGVYWIIPLMSFSILVGLALDYDIFLVARVVEFRRLGWSDRASVCLAVEKTGGIISVAGLIMVVSFAGLLIPKTVVLNQCVVVACVWRVCGVCVERACREGGNDEQQFCRNDCSLWACVIPTLFLLSTLSHPPCCRLRCSE